MPPLANTSVEIYMGTFVLQQWEAVYRPLAQLFAERGYPVRIHGLPRAGLGALDEASDELASSVFVGHPEQRFILVGHSQGGLHAFHHAKYYPASVEAVFAFGTPFHGTRLANLGRVLRMLPAVRGMAAHSRTLREWREDVSYIADNIYSLYSVLDELVVPWVASTVKGGHNVILCPKAIHWLLIRAGFRRSRGIELVDGWAEHLGVIWHPALHHYIESVLDELEQRANLRVVA